MSGLVVRAARVDDLTKVKALLAETWHDTYDALLGAERVTETTSSWHALDVLERQVSLPNASFLVALLKHQVIGHAFASEQGEGVPMLSRLYVLPGRQRRDVGTRLWVAIMERHPGTARVQLVVQPGNTKALAFYGRHGFTVISEVEAEGAGSLRLEKITDPACAAPTRNQRSCAD